MVELNVLDVRYRVHPDVYDPAEDTFLLAQALRGVPPGRLLEVGTGTGYVAISAAGWGHEVVGSDVNPTAVKLAAENAKLNGIRAQFVRTDLFRGIRIEDFDSVAFNPPYLPTSEGERLPGAINHAFDGGPDGRSVLDRFIRALPPRSPRTFIVGSSLQGLPRWVADAEALGFRVQERSRQRLPMERLFVLELTRR